MRVVIAFGASMVWLAVTVLRRPVEVTKKVADFVSGGRARGMNTGSPEPIRLNAMFMLLVGVGVIAFAIYPHFNPGIFLR